MVSSLRWLVLGVAAGAGCGFQLTFSSDAGSGDGRPIDGGATDGPIDPDAPTPDAPPLPALVDRGLVVRYFIDEAATGGAVANLSDSAPQPLSVPITYGQTMFVEDGGHRGLRWPSSGGNGKVELALGGNKIGSRLASAQTVTIEVVVKVEDAGNSGSESQITGLRGNNPDFVLAAFGSSSLRFFRPFGTEGATWLSANTQQRMVLHLVFDTTRVNGIDRIELFRDGVKLTKDSGSAPGFNSTVSLGGSDEFMIGNSRNQSRSIAGTIFYVAYYDVALDPTEIGTNATRLVASDDDL